MKNLFLLLTLTLTLSCCNKDDDPQPVSELDKLPPATQVGANTFGCLLDGKAFLPGNYHNSTNCFYQFTSGSHYFSVHANNINQDNYLISVGVGTNAKEIVQNGTYALEGMIPSNAYGTYALEGIPTRTNNTYTGELHISKLDPVNYIVSGTFWFDVLDFQGNLHQIRNGRFDMQYTN
jgi:hypothetical protein